MLENVYTRFNNEIITAFLQLLSQFFKPYLIAKTKQNYISFETYFHYNKLKL